MIAQRTIDDILERVSLHEIIAEGVSLKRQGSSFVGLCPFHSEKSPSFHVREDKFYHCFGCGVSGNAISYVMRARGLGFPEAVEELAGRLGIQVEYEGMRRAKSEGPDKKVLFQANALAARFFSACLSSETNQRMSGSIQRAAVHAREYLSDRKISDEAQRAFQIGFAPPEREALRAALSQRKITETTMLQAGLIRRSQRGDLYDTFRARIIFPIATDLKHIAGFGGRLIPSLVDEGTLTKAPKYLNSSDTPVYHKQAIFYGLPQALAAIRETKEVYLVEGYLDVIGLWQVGVRSVLATCGTAVTTQHVRRLRHLTRKVTLLFDGDNAGRAAAGKSYPIFQNSGLDVSAAFLSTDQDPDTFALAHGSATAAALAELPRVSLIECYIDLLVERTGATSISELGGASKGRLCEELAKVLYAVKNTIEQSELIERAALKLGVDGSLLREMVTSGSAGSSASHPSSGRADRHPDSGQRSRSASSSSPAARSSGEIEEHALTESSRSAQSGGGDDASDAIPAIENLPRLDRDLLLALMARKEDFPRDLLADPDLSTQVARPTLRFAQELWAIMGDRDLSEEDKKESLKELLDEFGESWRAHWKQAYVMASDREVDFAKMLQECRRAFAKSAINRQLKELERLSRTAPTEPERVSFSQQSVSLKRHLTQL